MRKLYILMLLTLISLKVNAQWVTIPDANFATWLNQNYPGCMNGNLMDTTCSSIITATHIFCNNKVIYDLTGIQYFDNLKHLHCKANYISSLPDLPVTLDSLDCSVNDLTTLPTLPPNLKYLNCERNFVLTSLPQLPDSLQSLDLTDNLVSVLPPLPLSLKKLDCGNNSLTNLPMLPMNLIELYCYNNQLTTLPPLPDSLEILNCNLNQLVSLPSLPFSLQTLFCSFNQISTLPTLNASLKMIGCSYNLLQSLPSLPYSLENLNCDNNFITSLPLLPNTLLYLWCNYNQLTTLPNLPNKMYHLECFNNQITSLSSLPDTIGVLNIKNNPGLDCLPLLKYIYNSFIFTGTNIQCVPNKPYIQFSSPQVNSLPICDIYNTNGCEVYWNISGTVYSDDNNNCQVDSLENKFANLKVNLYKDSLLVQQVYTDVFGSYYFDTSIDTFQYSIDTNNIPINITCPNSGFHSSLLSSNDSIDYDMDFAIECKPGYDVGVNNVLRSSGLFFPGNYATIEIKAGDLSNFYGLSCASGVSGNVIINMSGPISYISEVPGALIPTVTGQTLNYSITDFGTINFNSDFNFIVQTFTSAQANDQVCFDVIVNPISGDNDTINNTLQHCFNVVNSYDPNAKEVSPSGNISPDQEWLTYTIHFQNTGNAPAQNIFILDTLDQNLIHSSFTLLSYSHDVFTQILGNVVKFNFPNINLPDSTNDEPNSHGFVQYKIKVSPSLPLGTIISNTAYNFFDFNQPIATNSTNSEIAFIISVENIKQIFDFSIFPNPTNEELNISFTLQSQKEIKIELYNSLGQIVKAIANDKFPAGENKTNFSVSELPKGIYHFKFSAGDEVVVKRVVKM